MSYYQENAYYDLTNDRHRILCSYYDSHHSMALLIVYILHQFYQTSRLKPGTSGRLTWHCFHCKPCLTPTTLQAHNLQEQLQDTEDDTRRLADVVDDLMDGETFLERKTHWVAALLFRNVREARPMQGMLLQSATKDVPQEVLLNNATDLQVQQAAWGKSTGWRPVGSLA